MLALAYEARWRTVLPRLRELQALRGTRPVLLEEFKGALCSTKYPTLVYILAAWG